VGFGAAVDAGAVTYLTPWPGDGRVARDDAAVELALEVEGQVADHLLGLHGDAGALAGCLCEGQGCPRIDDLA
jgi:hypothetical protein